MTREITYLDHAAATPLDKRVFAAMRPFLTDHFYNPSAAYTLGREVRTAYEEARHRLAMTIGAQKSEVIITAGATESVTIAVHGIMHGHDGNCIIGATEHHAVRGATAPYETRPAPVDHTGMVSVSAMYKLIDDHTRLISVAMADSELGTVQPVKELAALVQRVREERRQRGVKTPLFLHSDGSQALGQLDVHIARLGVDLLTLNAAKCYGPKQVGLLWIRSGLVLEPYLRGGGQERGLRSGTENVAGAVGFAVAAELAVKQRHEHAHELAQRRDQLQSALQALMPDLVVDGHPKRRLPGHLHISLAGLDAERVVFALDAQGICIATGAACAANKGTRSPVLEAIGMDASQADGSMRLSLGRLNDKTDIKRLASVLATTIAKERQL